MMTTTRLLTLPGAMLLASLAAQYVCAEPPRTLPRWFEEHRVQAHFENGIQDDLAGLYERLHPAIRTMGSQVLTRIFKTTAEGAWWPTTAGYTHEGLDGRDLGRAMAHNAHEHGLRVFAYYRIMCDDFVEKEHPQWLCRGVDGKLVLEPRTRRRPKEEDRKHVICFNSPARELITTRLLELADRGVDGIYFDSWHMPEVCTCENCQAAYRRETGKMMDITARRGTEGYRQNAQFVARSIVRNFRDWQRAVKAKHPDVLFAIGSSLYPCFHTQMQITAALLRISDTSKTEFSKPFGGFLGWPITGTLPKVTRRRYSHLDDTFALPTYDLQNALGWSFTRDSCDGRPPLMWIPFTRTEQKAMFSAAAAVSYGCIASIHPTGLWNRRASEIQMSATDIYKPCYALGERISRHLASTRPLRFALVHISERSRNHRIADPRALWVELFAPVLGAFETLKENHWPVATINDLQLAEAIPAETQLLILPHARELSDEQRSALKRFESASGTVVRLDDDRGWHLKSDKPDCKRELLRRITTQIQSPPILARGPAAMHAVFFQEPGAQKQVVCLVNDFGWFRSERGTAETTEPQQAPVPCRDVVIELSAPESTVRKAWDAVTGKALAIRRENGKTKITVPDFPVMACVVIDRAKPVH